MQYGSYIGNGIDMNSAVGKEVTQIASGLNNSLVLNSDNESVLLVSVLSYLQLVLSEYDSDILDFYDTDILSIVDVNEVKRTNPSFKNTTDKIKKILKKMNSDVEAYKNFIRLGKTELAESALERINNNKSEILNRLYGSNKHGDINATLMTYLRNASQHINNCSLENGVLTLKDTAVSYNNDGSVNNSDTSIKIDIKKLFYLIESLHKGTNFRKKIGQSTSFSDSVYDDLLSIGMSPETVDKLKTNLRSEEVSLDFDGFNSRVNTSNVLINIDIADQTNSFIKSIFDNPDQKIKFNSENYYTFNILKFLLFRESIMTKNSGNTEIKFDYSFMKNTIPLINYLANYIRANSTRYKQDGIKIKIENGLEGEDYSELKNNIWLISKLRDSICHGKYKINLSNGTIEIDNVPEHGKFALKCDLPIELFSYIEINELFFYLPYAKKYSYDEDIVTVEEVPTRVFIEETGYGKIGHIYGTTSDLTDDDFKKLNSCLLVCVDDIKCLDRNILSKFDKNIHFYLSQLEKGEFESEPDIEKCGLGANVASLNILSYWISVIENVFDRNPEWNKLEKAMYIYNYVVCNLNYADESTLVKNGLDDFGCFDKYSGINALCYGEGNSKGYSNILSILYSQFDISYHVRNNGCHSWVDLLINDQLYMIDPSLESLLSRSISSGISDRVVDGYVEGRGYCLFNYFGHNPEYIKSDLYLKFTYDKADLYYSCFSSNELLTAIDNISNETKKINLSYGVYKESGYSRVHDTIVGGDYYDYYVMGYSNSDYKLLRKLKEELRNESSSEREVIKARIKYILNMIKNKHLIYLELEKYRLEQRIICSPHREYFTINGQYTLKYPSITMYPLYKTLSRGFEEIKRNAYVYDPKYSTIDSRKNMNKTLLQIYLAINKVKTEIEKLEQELELEEIQVRS